MNECYVQSVWKNYVINENISFFIQEQGWSFCILDYSSILVWRNHYQSFVDDSWMAAEVCRPINLVIQMRYNNTKVHPTNLWKQWILHMQLYLQQPIRFNRRWWLWSIYDVDIFSIASRNLAIWSVSGE